MKKDVDYYMNLPYKIELTKILPEMGDGWHAEIPILWPGSIKGTGDDPNEAVESLYEIMPYMLGECIENGDTIPEPDMTKNINGTEEERKEVDDWWESEEIQNIIKEK